MGYVFNNKVALITGGAKGIGLSFVRELIKNDIKGILIADIHEEAAENVMVDFDCNTLSFIKTDVSNCNQLESAFEECMIKFGQIDIVINNAAIGSEKDWNLLIQTNATAVCRGTLLGFKYMGKDHGGNGGVIVNNSSIFGVYYSSTAPVYTASKHFVTALSRSMGTDYYYDLTGVRVMCMCPSTTDTEMVADWSIGRLQFDGIEERVQKQALELGPAQKVESCAEGLIKMLNDGKNGSAWIVNQGKTYEHESTSKVFA